MHILLFFYHSCKDLIRSQIRSHYVNLCVIMLEQGLAGRSIHPSNLMVALTLVHMHWAI